MSTNILFCRSYNFLINHDLYILNFLWKCIVTTLGMFLNKVHGRDTGIAVK